MTELSIPVYFFHGIYDYTCSYTEARAYFEVIKAPVKGFYTFDQSAHSPIFEEPDKVRRILNTDVLAGTNSLTEFRMTRTSLGGRLALDIVRLPMISCDTPGPQPRVALVAQRRGARVTVPYVDGLACGSED